MKYYIVKTNNQTGKKDYKRYKCISGFTTNRELCWKFSRQGALKIIKDLKREYRINYEKGILDFSLEEAD